MRALGRSADEVSDRLAADPLTHHARIYRIQMGYRPGSDARPY